MRIVPSLHTRSFVLGDVVQTQACVRVLFMTGRRSEKKDEPLGYWAHPQCEPLRKHNTLDESDHRLICMRCRNQVSKNLLPSLQCLRSMAEFLRFADRQVTIISAQQWTQLRAPFNCDVIISQNSAAYRELRWWRKPLVDTRERFLLLSTCRRPCRRTDQVVHVERQLVWAKPAWTTQVFFTL